MKHILCTLAAGAALIALPALAVSETSGAAQAAELDDRGERRQIGRGPRLCRPPSRRRRREIPRSKGRPSPGAWRKAQKGGFSVTFTGLAPGRYAVNGFHDTDGDGELDTNLLGIPTEGYGFGNGAAGSFGPPDFTAASIAVEGKASVELPIGY